MAKVNCAVCLGDGKVHLPTCPAFHDFEVTCQCGMRPCPLCVGEARDLKRAQDYMRLVERANKLLRYPLTGDDRDYVQDLIRRLGAGNQPILSDWFRSQELVSKYARRSPRKNEARTRKLKD